MKFYETALVAIYIEVAIKFISSLNATTHNKPITRKTTIEGRIQRITIILPGFRSSTFFHFLKVRYVNMLFGNDL